MVEGKILDGRMGGVEQVDGQQTEQQRGPGLIRFFWVFLLLLALYVGSVGPVMKYNNKRVTPVIDAFYKPLEIIYKRLPVAKRFFDWYFHLWMVE
jgi:hypothetical protein